MHVGSARFGIVSNGFATGPAQPLRDFLIDRGAGQVVTIFHPLSRLEPARHEVKIWERGSLIRERTYALPSRPPLTYPLDLLAPLWPPAVDCWFGFNALATSRGLAARRMGRAGKVVYWCVDFVRERFGRNPATTLYEGLDGLCCRRSDARFELSDRARDARDARHAGQALAPSRLVPMGAWLDLIPTTPADGQRARKIVYLGSLIPTQGGVMFIGALGALARAGVEFTAEIIGRGPLEEEMKRKSAALGLDGRVRFHGFVEDDLEIARILAASSVGVAAYDPHLESFTRWADPGKLKLYVAAGLPIVLTDVPPNARQLEAAGVAELAEFDEAALAGAIRNVIESPDEWRRRRRAALSFRSQYDWTDILTGALDSLDFDVH